jgi:hypothetical protein
MKCFETTRWQALCACALVTLAAACEEGAGAPSPDPGGRPAETQAAAPATAAPSAEAAPPSAEAAAPASATASAVASAAGPGASAKPSAVAVADGSAPEGSAAPSASAAPADEPAGKVKGKAESEAMYSAWLQSAGRYVVGAPASVQAVLVAKGGFHCNDKYPYKFKLSGAPEGVTYADSVARGIRIGKERSVLTVPFTPTSAGAKTISGTFFFSVCDDKTCKIGKAAMAVTVEVNES